MAIADFSERTLQELVSLEGRAAVVTGGARGLGLAICNRLSEAGASVVVADLDGGAAEKAASSISENGGKALGLEVDATDSGSLSELADKTVSEYGRLDIWVNNAGVYPFQDLLEMTDEDWKKVVDLNLSGSFYGSREAAKRMQEAGNGGVIVNLSSTAGYKAEGPRLAHYVSTKHGVRGLTKSLAVALGGDGIRVLALAPTLIATEGVGEARGTAGDDGQRRSTGGFLRDASARKGGRGRRCGAGSPVLRQRPVEIHDRFDAAGGHRRSGIVASSFKPAPALASCIRCQLNTRGRMKIWLQTLNRPPLGPGRMSSGG